MDAKKRYVFFLSLVVCMASSCTSDSPDGSETAKGGEMLFAVSDISRGSVTTVLNAPGSKFVVYGDRILPDDETGSPINVFDKTEVEYAGDSWQYDRVQYWISDNDYSFVSVFPSSVIGAYGSVQYSDSRLSFAYSVPVSSGSRIEKMGVTDILGATHRRYYTGSDGLPVTFRFSHLMSLINVTLTLSDNVVSSEEYIKLHKLELTGVKSKGVFSILPAPRHTNNQTDDRVIEVTGQDGETNMVIEFAQPLKVENTGTGVTIFDHNDAIIMLPQTFANDSQGKIILTYSNNDDSRTKSISGSLKQMAWESGKSYNYKFTLERKGLVLSSTNITDWEEMNVGNIDVE